MIGQVILILYPEHDMLDEFARIYRVGEAEAAEAMALERAAARARNFGLTARRREQLEQVVNDWEDGIGDEYEDYYETYEDEDEDDEEVGPLRGSSETISQNGGDGASDSQEGGNGGSGSDADVESVAQ